MGSSVSCTGNTNFIKTELEKKERSERKTEECTEKDESSSHCLKIDPIEAPPSKGIVSTLPGDHFEAPPTNDILTPPPAPFITKLTLNKQKDIVGDKDNGTDKSTDIEEAGIREQKIDNESMTNEVTNEEQEWMTDEELKELDNLRNTAEKVLALQIQQQRAFVTEIYNAPNIFFNSYYALKKADRITLHKFRKEIAKLMMETKYINLSCEIVMNTYRNGWRNEDGNEDESMTVPLTVSLLTLHNFSDCSDEYAIGLAKAPGLLDTLKRILGDSLPKYLVKEGEGPKLTESEERLMSGSLGVIWNMSRRESNMSSLRAADMISCMIPYLKSPNKQYALTALASLAAIIKEEECDIIKSNKEIVMHLLDCIRKGMKDKMRICEGWSCQECVFIVKLLARNDTNIKTLVELGALELLVEMARIGDEDEQYESVSALWALCFDEDNQSLITGKPELEVVDLLVDLKSSKNKKIKNVCNGALWTLRDVLKKTVVEKYKKIAYLAVEALNLFPFSFINMTCWEQLDNKDKTDRLEKTLSRGHVMISYQWADQKILRIVRDKIKARGYKVWMDIDEMGGSTLQAISKGVENAAVFLMCMSDKYKHSLFCRSEAEYAFKLGKTVIPLKMERGYDPDGWLGLIAGAKLYFEFSTKYPFEVKMTALLKEITVVLDGSGNVPDSGMIIKPQVASTTIDNVRKWTADDVKQWIGKNGLEKCGISSLTGGDIALLASMHVECPDLLYKCLQDMLK
ncbi:uncharacterized protein LOC132727835, partial [Ruditapes philippinarum]|uniref:uncharacterized protein LOC132727835 n=1 Tax=Ruditapes philippinarum TaxID=129788 RepID=UPI00295BC592